MTVRTFHNPEVPGSHARTVTFGDVVIGPGETKQVDLPRLTVWDNDGNVLGQVDQQCPHLLEEIDAPTGLVFEPGVEAHQGTLVVDAPVETPEAQAETELEE